MKIKNISYLLFALCIALPSWAKTIPDNATLDVHLELPVIETTSYARPYVAVWLENEQKKSVRTLQLWVGKDDWLKDLRSWWRKVGRNDRQLVDAVTSASRPAGKYRFTWDGLNDQGERIEQGEYTLYIEVVREHGGRNILRQKLQLFENGFSKQLKPTQETGLITLKYRTK
ncbi:DUF2271 domain-containing protein [Psychromonas sp. RZ22]|uniref:DUF2271 domain-containing protein n=1 Tax=Psychromonas algarum TaxID=2555643 RepID=UPI0010678060|nr:DUF2271 domain-containing protein [Psychromonas sp. RZ22]TEW54592.1 DUF2271 domain-containing protein [Psychromonas sp. RZ22]